MQQQESEGSQDRGKQGFRISSNTMTIYLETENTKRVFEKPSNRFSFVVFLFPFCCPLYRRFCYTRSLNDSSKSAL